MDFTLDSKVCALKKEKGRGWGAKIEKYGVFVALIMSLPSSILVYRISEESGYIYSLSGSSNFFFY